MRKTLSVARPLLREAASPKLAGLLGLGALSLAFLGLPLVAWGLTGEWVPETAAFGASAAVVGLVARYGR